MTTTVIPIRYLTNYIRYANNFNIIKRYNSNYNNRSYSSLGVIIDSDYVNIDEKLVKSYSDIPGPKGLPIIGNSWRFAPIVGQYKIEELDKVMWSLYKEYGKIVRVSGLIGHPDLLFVFDGDAIQKVFRREEVMPHRPSMPSLHYYKQQLHKDFFKGNEGVIGVHGPKWDRFRRQVQQFLLAPKTAKSYIEPLDDIASDFITRMEKLMDVNRELPNNFLTEIYKWALESVARVSLDTRLGCLNDKCSEDAKKVIESINTFFWNVAEIELKLPIWRLYETNAFKKYIGALDTFRITCLKYIEQTIHQKDDNNQLINDSIVQKMLKLTGNTKLAAVLALDLFLVGIDTTSIALASIIYQLSQNPLKQEKLFDELQELLPEQNSKMTAEVQGNMPYLKACIKETLRMYPVIIGNGRNLQSDTIIDGFNVPKGTHVIFPHLVTSNISSYFDEPEVFKPERWLKNKNTNCPLTGINNNSNKIHPFVSLPFGYGRRSCLGRRFAELELQILLAKLFRKYKVEYHYERFTYKITPTYVPKQPLKFKLIERT